MALTSRLNQLIVLVFLFGLLLVGCKNESNHSTDELSDVLIKKIHKDYWYKEYTLTHKEHDVKVNRHYFDVIELMKDPYWNSAIKNPCQVPEMAKERIKLYEYMQLLCGIQSSYDELVEKYPVLGEMSNKERCDILFTEDYKKAVREESAAPKSREI